MSRFQQNLIAVLGALAFAGNLLAASVTPELQSLATVTRYSPMEAAGSRGSIGFSAGLSMESAEFADPMVIDAPSASGRTNQDGDATRRFIPRVAVTKGTRWPVDFGFCYTHPTESTAEAFGAHTQVTLYEELGLPAISARVSHARLFGVAGEMQSSNISAIVTQGFVRYFRFSLGIGTTFNEGSWTRSAVSGGQTWDLRGKSAETESASWWEMERTAGLAILIVPPYFTLSAETTYMGDRQSYGAKFAVAL